MELMIRQPASGDEPRWRERWLGYLEFYEAPEIAHRTDRLWTQLLDPDDPFRCRLAIAVNGTADDTIVGIVHFVEHHDTWFDKPIIYLADLYVDADQRGNGIARRLIDEVVQVARDNDNPQVYWHTNQDNAPARLLYDKMTGGPNGFIMYELSTEGD